MKLVGGVFAENSKKCQDIEKNRLGYYKAAGDIPAL